MPFNIGGHIYNGTHADVEDYKNIITRGLVLHLDASALESYPGSGTSWYDMTTNGNAEGVNSPVYYSTTPSFTLFNTTNVYFSLGNNTNFKSMVGDVTLIGWCKQESRAGPHQTVLCTDTAYRGGIKLMSSYHGSIAVWVANGNGTSEYLLSSDNIETTGWHCLSATRNSTDGSLKLYLDGVLKNSVTTFTGNTFSNQVATVGIEYHSSGYYYNGYIATCMGYNRVLTDTEILQNYNIQKGRFGL